MLPRMLLARRSVGAQERSKGDATTYVTSSVVCGSTKAEQGRRYHACYWLGGSLWEHGSGAMATLPGRRAIGLQAELVVGEPSAFKPHNASTGRERRQPPRRQSMTLAV